MNDDVAMNTSSTATANAITRMIVAFIWSNTECDDLFIGLPDVNAVVFYDTVYFISTCASS